MKKFINLFAKGKRNEENLYNFYDVSLPESVNKHFIETCVFKYYQFDSEGNDANEPGYKISFSSKTEDKELFVQPLVSSDTVASTVNNSAQLDFELKNDSLVSKTDSDSDHSAASTGTKSEKKSKVRKDIYLINVSNSKYFHIGTQKTININEKPLIKKNSQGSEAQKWLQNHTFMLNVDFQNLLNSEERLGEKYILLISQHVNGNWKEFLKYLGLDETALEILELRNNNNKIFTVYDALQKYMTKFPNTSLGFIVYALSEIHQVVVMEKLVQELPT